MIRARTAAAAARAPRRLAALVLAIAVVVFAGCTTAPPVDQADAAKVDALLSAMRARLDDAARAARATWPGGAPPDQPIWEARLLDAGINRAADFALPPEVVADFLRAQLDAGRRIEAGLHADWKATRQGPFADAADADGGVVRGRWAAALPDLLGALARAWPVLRAGAGRELLERRARTVLAGTPGGAPVATAAIAPLWQLAR